MKKQKINFLNPENRIRIQKLFDELHAGVDLLYELATIDEKTGLYNNKFFNSIFDIEFSKAIRGQKLSLAVSDIDHFKKLNDTHGHLQADKLLKVLADLYKNNLRKYDIVARFGGEEFFILLPNTDSKRARKVMERMRKKILEDRILKKYNLTVSIGISEYKNGDNKTRLKQRADKAVYKAKHEGRNRVVIN